MILPQAMGNDLRIVWKRQDSIAKRYQKDEEGFDRKEIGSRELATVAIF